MLKKLFSQSTIYNSFRLKKHFILSKQFISVEKKIIRIKKISFQFKITHFDLKKTIFKGKRILTEKGNKAAFSMSFRIFESSFSITKSVSDNSKLTPLETREPLKQSNADLSRAKDTFDGIHDMLVA